MRITPSNQSNFQLIRQLLQGYGPSAENIKLFEQLKTILLTAPTAAGRNSVISKLAEKGNYHYLVSDTTRKPRYNNDVLEKNGQVYWFKTEKEFLKSLEEKNYLEAAIIHNQQASGINISEILNAKNNNKYAITDIDIVGCVTLIRLSKNTLPIFLLPPNFTIWMNRLKGRGQLSDDELNRRLQSAKTELTHALEKQYFQFIVNDILDETVDKIDNLVERGINVDDQVLARNKAKELLKNLN